MQTHIATVRLDVDGVDGGDCLDSEKRWPKMEKMMLICSTLGSPC